MTFPATIAQLLLSSPNDLPQEHREVVIRAIRTWNNSHGRRVGVVFSPTNWEEGSSPEYGIGAQDSLNRQVVDSSDLGLVIFTDRLGTPTKDHESGTVEEIERLHDQGKRVAILRNMVPREPSRDTPQSAALATYLDGIRDKALYREYRSLQELLEIVNSTLNDVSFSIDPPQQAPSSDDGVKKSELALGVWPVGDRERYQDTDSKGNLKFTTRHRILLQNATGVPVTDVSIRLEDAEGNPANGVRLLSDPIARLAPGAKHPVPFIRHRAPDSAICTVIWTDPDGEVHETSATISLV